MKRSKQRQQAKLARGKGQLAMKQAGMDHSQWTQNFDPLFKVKGQERHLKIAG